MKKKNILITCGGRRVSLLESFKIELKKIYPEGLVYIADSKPCLSSAAQLSHGFFEVPELCSPNYINKLSLLRRVRSCWWHGADGGGETVANQLDVSNLQ